MIRFTRRKNIYFVFSGAIIAACLVFLLIWGLKPGIDFTGGTILELEYVGERPSNQEILERLNAFNLGNIYSQPSGEKGVILRLQDITEETHQDILAALKQETILVPKEDGTNEMQLILSDIEEKRFESVGPVIGEELKTKTKYVILAALALMIIYIALAFRKVQRPLKSWQYGIISVVALAHDILLSLGVFAVLGKFYGTEVSIPIITALLAVLGYSINNTVVVFDRIRENLLKRGESFEDTIDISLNQTLSRQINTSLTTFLAVGAIFFFGGESLKYFALALMIGIAAGTYSSLFLAGPLLAAWHRLKQRT